MKILPGFAKSDMQKKVVMRGTCWRALRASYQLNQHGIILKQEGIGDVAERDKLWPEKRKEGLQVRKRRKQEGSGKREK